MNHPDIEEHQVLDRYVMGKLPPEEAELFEDHYLSCPQCLDQLALAESMQRGFKRAAGQDVARLAATRQLALFAWLSRLGRSRQVAVLAMALLVVVVAVLPGSLALRRLGDRDRELAATRRELNQERERASAGSRTATEVEKLRSELDASQRALTQEREARAEAARQLAQVQTPQENVPILNLDQERGGPSGEPPTHRLHRPPAAGWAVFTLLLDEQASADTYRVSLRNAGGKEIWTGSLARMDNDVLNLSLPGSLLQPGVYTLVAQGTEGPPSRSRFTFLVQP